MKARRNPVYAFSSFVFDSENGELTQNGLRVRINKQTADLLTLLIHNAGQLVTRENIREVLWPNQEFLNHEKIITNAVSRLRQIFRDDPTKPQYVESIPKRGYRLVIKVEQLTPNAAEPSSVAPLAIQARNRQPAPPPEPVILAVAAPIPEAPAQPARPAKARRKWIYLVPASAVIAIASLAASWIILHRHPEPEPNMSLGVAPFESSGEDAKELAESFRLDLTDTLSQLPHVSVRGAYSLEHLSLDKNTFEEKASKLGLDAIIFGRFTPQGNHYHLEFEVVRGRDFTHLTSFQYDVTREELASVRDKIQHKIFDLLSVSASGKSHLPDITAQGGTTDPDAYDAYLRAGYHLSQQTPDSIRLALQEYGEAIARDPNFAKAYAHRARTYIFLGEHNLIPHPESFREADAAANKALQLDPSSAEAHSVLGLVYSLRDWNLKAGESESRKAIQLDPHQPLYHQWLALLLCDQGRFQEALQEIDIAHADDPFWLSAYVTEAHIASFAHDIPRVEATVRKLMELMPESAHARDAIANAQWYIGYYPEAIAAWRAMAQIEGDADRLALEDRGLIAFQTGGPTAYARVRLEAIQSGKGVARHPNDFDPSEWYANADQPQAALQAIHADIEHHDQSILELGVMPSYSSLHQNPEFQSILSSLNLPLPPEKSARR